MAAPTISAIVGADKRTISVTVSAADSTTTKDTIFVRAGYPLISATEVLDNGCLILHNAPGAHPLNFQYDCFQQKTVVAIIREHNTTPVTYSVAQQNVGPPIRGDIYDWHFIPPNIDILSHQAPLFPHSYLYGVNAKYYEYEPNKFEIRGFESGASSWYYWKTHASLPVNIGWEVSIDHMVETASEYTQFTLYGGETYYTWCGCNSPTNTGKIYSFYPTFNQDVIGTGGGITQEGTTTLNYTPGQWMTFKFVYDPGLSSDGYGTITEWVKRYGDSSFTMMRRYPWAKCLGGPSIFFATWSATERGSHWRNLTSTVPLRQLKWLASMWQLAMQFDDPWGFDAWTDYYQLHGNGEQEGWFGFLDEPLAIDEGVYSDPNGMVHGSLAGSVTISGINTTNFYPEKVSTFRYDAGDTGCAGSLALSDSRSASVSPGGSAQFTAISDITSIVLSGSRQSSSQRSPQFGAIVLDFNEEETTNIASGIAASTSQAVGSVAEVAPVSGAAASQSAVSAVIREAERITAAAVSGSSAIGHVSVVSTTRYYDLAEAYVEPVLMYYDLTVEYNVNVIDALFLGAGF